MAELASQPTSVQTVYTWYRDGKLFVNRRYQRKLVWTQEEKQKLIESLLKKYPIPAILIAERESASGTYEIIDGLQRLHSIVSFIEAQFPLEDGRYFDIEHFPTAKSAADEKLFEPQVSSSKISSKEVSTILDYSLAFSVMRNATENEVNDVFDRINTYGHRLSDQERRQSGVQNDFSTMVRELACTLRGDTSQDILPLGSMPSISIDLPKSNHGYEVKADEVFWVNQGILRSTDLRDSADEQCVADIAACIVGGSLIERSKDALDEIYTRDSDESERILNALEVYGSEKLSEEIKHCIEQILETCNDTPKIKLRELLFDKGGSNPFPAVFAILMIAFHELIMDEYRVSNRQTLRDALNNLSSRIETGRKSTSVVEKRKNIDTIKGLILSSFIKDKEYRKTIYNNNTSVDIASMIRRSEIELPNYELKQGILTLASGGGLDPDIMDKLIKTICEIANIGRHSSGTILLGVTDKPLDAKRVKELDGIEAQKIGRRLVVGVDREARRLKISKEAYFGLVRDGIRNSDLSDKLKSSVLSSLEFNDFYGLGILAINIPPQTEVSYVGEEVFCRNGDSTEKVTSAKLITAIASRF